MASADQSEEGDTHVPWSSASLSPDSPIYEARQQQANLAVPPKHHSPAMNATVGFVEESDPGEVGNGDVSRSRMSVVRPVPITEEAIREEYGDETEDLLRSSSADDMIGLQDSASSTLLPSTILEEPADFVLENAEGDMRVPEQAPLQRNTGSLGASSLRRRKSVDDLACEARNDMSATHSDQDMKGIVPPRSFSASPLRKKKAKPSLESFEALYTSTKFFEGISARFLQKHYTPFAAATWIGFWALLNVTCATYVLTPMRDAIALSIGVEHIPSLTLASTALAVFSSVPIGWLFEAPDPSRRRLFKRMGLTRGETQGTSLALFYRCFAIILVSYAVGFSAIEWLQWNDDVVKEQEFPAGVSKWWPDWTSMFTWLGKFLYIAFFLVVHLMKLHSLSLVWGVTTEAMEYEEVARKRSKVLSTKTRLQRLALVGFGGTLGGILGSALASSMVRYLRLPGLLMVAAFLLEISAELSIELGRIMQKFWEAQQLFQSSSDLISLDHSIKKSASVGSMKRIASGNSLNRVKSATELSHAGSNNSGGSVGGSSTSSEQLNDDTFFQRLMRGITTILRSRLLMAIFTYNALYASTTVLLSFQRAALVANRSHGTSAEADTAFLANINMASSVVVFVLQASGIGAFVAHTCGARGTLALMPLIRLLGVLSLAWWHQTSQGKPPNLLLFLVADECCKIMNLAVAKPVRESLWRGLSNEARYEAKPIVDTLANRWGSGSAAFLVSFLNRALDLFGVQASGDGTRLVFGFPPVLFLCMMIATWWAALSADLGHIRHRIDLELKKRQ
jgi:hypothetical protein